MSDNNFVKQYLEDLSNTLKPNDQLIKQIVDTKNILIQTKKDKGKVIICGNGGSAAIASHVSVDLTKNANIRSINFNEADLITCLAKYQK